MELREETHRVIGMEEFSRINYDYDENQPLAKPQKRWWPRAKCKNVPIEDRDRIFFPTRQPGQTLDQMYKEAKRYCRGCPVKKDCLVAALQEEGSLASGMRGGKNHAQRRQLWFEQKHKGLQRRKSTHQPTRS